MFKDLIARRVPHILGFYFGAGWVVLEFTDYIVNRYILSPHLADFALMFWALMFPTVFMLAYFHGRPGRAEWATAEKIGIPLNLVLAGAVLYSVFAGTELGAATTQVAIQDETGQVIERTVPKGTLRKRLAIFYFENESSDTTIDWLGYALSLGIRTDLLQDIFVDARGSAHFRERLNEEGYPDGVGIPLALRRDIADELHLEHFVSGSLAGSESELVVTLQLYDVRRGKLIQERTFSGVGVFDLIDEITVQLKRDLGIPEQHIEDGKDLPFSELATKSLTAYRSFVTAVRALDQDNWVEGAAALEEAVRQDSTYALANFYLFEAYLVSNEGEKANAALRAAMDYAYKLPERVQFIIKANYYLLVKQDSEKAIRVAQMLIEFFPEDIIGHSMLVQMYANAGEHAKAIESATRILELDPGELEMLRAIGNFYQQLGRYEEASSYFEDFAAEAPSDPRAFNDLGDLARTMGEHDRALEYYERALLLDTDNVPVLIDMASTEAAIGNFDRALELLEEAVKAAQTPSQRYEAYDALHNLYRRRGEIQKAIEYMHRGWAELAKTSPINALLGRLSDFDTYVIGGQPERAQTALDSLADQLNPPLDLFVAIGRLDVAKELEDAEGIEEALEGMERLMAALGFEVFRPLAVEGNGKLLEVRGDYEQAIVAYERVLQLAPSQLVAVNTHIGRCYRKLGRYDDAVRRLEQVIASEPYAPGALLELARVYSQSGEPERGAGYYEKALEVWENADQEFKPAREARAELAALQVSA